MEDRKKIATIKKVQEEIDHLLSLADGFICSDIAVHDMEKGFLKQLLFSRTHKTLGTKTILTRSKYLRQAEHM